MGLQTIKQEALLMGNRFELTALHPDPVHAARAIEAGIEEIRRIEALFSTYRADSETNRINAAAGIKPVVVSDEMIDLIERSNRISEITQGAFDITYGSIDKQFWNFDTAMKALPPRGEARKRTRLVNYRNVVIDREQHTVWLRYAGMRIGFGGIGKGYAAEAAKQLMQQQGIESGIVNASGDLAVWGEQASGEAWTVGIVHPDASGLPFALMEMRDSAVATSGNYEKFVMIGGKRYSHTIDPRSGYPVTGIKSVTIFSPNAEVCDALATPVTIMGVEAGLYLINQLNGVEAVVIDDQNRLYSSANIHLS